MACARARAINRLMHANPSMVPSILDRVESAAPWLVGGVASQNTRRVASRHRHDRGQILGTVAGVIGILTDTSYWLVGPGQTLWLPPGLDHAARSHGAFAGWSLYITTPRAATLSETPFLIQTTRLLAAQAERLAEQTHHDVWNEPLAMLAETFWHEFLSAQRATVALPLPVDPRLRRVAEALIEDPADQRAEQAWAAVAGMSLRSFVRHFSAQTGLPFSAWRQRARIVNAQERLARDEAVTSVALSVGYESLGAFAAVFRKLTGLSPSDYSGLCRAKT
ncbi:AraC family transcriptional regulator [Acidisoma cladoniae]|uniref:AraC family transcriptional regulator n=1 Tax=Acidisoma cladoniae TaxID=3040935 RepID=UPI00254A6481|nr:helix-turn-helix transcriptional regulator [Acidisoma sp. PAMC 29798]